MCLDFEEKGELTENQTDAGCLPAERQANVKLSHITLLPHKKLLLSLSKASFCSVQSSPVSIL